MYQTYIQYLTYCFVLNTLAILLKLTPQVDGIGVGDEYVNSNINSRSLRCF